MVDSPNQLDMEVSATLVSNLESKAKRPYLLRRITPPGEGSGADGGPRNGAIVRRVHTDLSSAIRVLKPARSILVFTGAGISTESGIPDFRGPDGLWTRMDPDDFTMHRYLADPEIRKRSWAMHQEGFFGGMLAALPNRAHLALVPLWSNDRMAGCVTQNIDGLHQRAGLPEEAVAELHGNLQRVHCTACPASWETKEILAVVADGDPDPTCFGCGAIVKTSTVLFGELLPQEAWERSHPDGRGCRCGLGHREHAHRLPGE